MVYLLFIHSVDRLCVCFYVHVYRLVVESVYRERDIYVYLDIWIYIYRVDTEIYFSTLGCVNMLCP